MTFPIIKNAIISGAALVIERGFILSGWVYVDMDNGSQSFGGFVLGGIGDAKCADHANQPNLAAIWLAGVMTAAEVDDFSKLTGKVIRIGKNDEWGSIEAIGHPVKPYWFNPRAEFDALRADEGAKP